MDLSFQLQMGQRQQQQLILTPKMQQAIEMLQLNSLELEQYLEEQLVTNPVLEEEQTTPEQEVPTPDSEREPENGEDPLAEFAHVLNDDFYGSSFERGNTPPPSREDPKRSFIENSITTSESLQDNLEQQLALVTDDTIIRALAKWIISEIDERGYFTGTLEDGADRFDVPVELAEEALRVVQSLSPPGIGARNPQECILLQIEQQDPTNELLKTVVRDHFDALAKKQYSQIASALKITVEEVQELADELRLAYEPFPGRELGHVDVQYVKPDVSVQKVDGEYIVTVDDDGMPRLRISQRYRRLLKEAGSSRETKEYIRDKLRAAQWLVRNIQQRKDTIRKVTQEIVNVQQDFLDRGIQFMKPLTLREIAERIGMHESTVSRVTSNKYVETPRGVFPLKFFFSSGIENAAGDSVASKSVKEMIQQLIDKEEKRKPLSDQKITNILNERGINIARRTTAKYREELGILPSKYRREYA